MQPDGMQSMNCRQSVCQKSDHQGVRIVQSIKTCEEPLTSKRVLRGIPKTLARKLAAAVTKSSASSSSLSHERGSLEVSEATRAPRAVRLYRTHHRQKSYNHQLIAQNCTCCFLTMPLNSRMEDLPSTKQPERVDQ